MNCYVIRFPLARKPIIVKYISLFFLVYNSTDLVTGFVFLSLFNIWYAHVISTALTETARWRYRDLKGSRRGTFQSTIPMFVSKTSRQTWEPALSINQTPAAASHSARTSSSGPIDPLSCACVVAGQWIVSNVTVICEYKHIAKWK